MANNKIAPNLNNRNTPPLTPELISQISERSGIEPRYVALWGSQLETGNVTDQDGARLIEIWMRIVRPEVAVQR